MYRYVQYCSASSGSTCITCPSISTIYGHVSTGSMLITTNCVVNTVTTVSILIWLYLSECTCFCCLSHLLLNVNLSNICVHYYNTSPVFDVHMYVNYVLHVGCSLVSRQGVNTRSLHSRHLFSSDGTRSS